MDLDPNWNHDVGPNSPKYCTWHTKSLLIVHNCVNISYWARYKIWTQYNGHFVNNKNRINVTLCILGVEDGGGPWLRGNGHPWSGSTVCPWRGSRWPWRSWFRGTRDPQGGRWNLSLPLASLKQKIRIRYQLKMNHERDKITDSLQRIKILNGISKTPGTEN